MRSARGSIYELHGYFHVENSLKRESIPFSKEEASEHCRLMLELAKTHGLEPVFWQFHPLGFGVLIHKRAPFPDSGNDSAQNRLQDFIKTLKQLIASDYNRRRGLRGSIWRDRTKLFHIPDSRIDRLEVAAYIMARPEMENGQAHPDWPSAWQSATEGVPIARAGIRRLFSKQQFAATQVEQLQAQHHQILTILADSAHPTLPRHRGRRPEWRPDCERAGRANEGIKPPDPAAYRQRKREERAHFSQMLQRYKRFCQKSGLKKIPRGDPDAPELRQWAAAIRGRYRQGRLSARQLDALAGTAILEPANAPRSNSPD